MGVISLNSLNLSLSWPKRFPEFTSWPAVRYVSLCKLSVCYCSAGLAMLALTRAWSTASSRFLLSMARVCAAESICFLHSSFREVMAFCWASRILLISSAMSLFSSFSVPSICSGENAALNHLCEIHGAFDRWRLLIYQVWDLAPPWVKPANCRSWIP